ncbi:hypothetical protein PQX77_011569 [Marasmius sp. AFHP31]|nr:hypothetical protein PQX77_011569 [Marasmius sp. AFHP31]
MATIRIFQLALIFLATAVLQTNAHIAAWSKGMYCLNGTTPGEDNGNNNSPVTPLFKLKKKDWWMHHVDKCDEFPPAPGDFLELPANGNFTVELATNRAFTTFSSGGKQAKIFPGPLTGGTKNDRTEGQEGKFKIGQKGAEGEVPGCIVDPNLHTQNESMASGTAFAISYTSDLKKVTPENLVVFTVLEHTPFRRLATYQVPNLPACPPGGCICTWGWIPNGCGEPNMYFFPYRCNVTGTPGSMPLALPARPANWCDMSLPLTTKPANATTTGKDEEQRLGACYKGAKQMLFWNQLEGDNIETLDGELGARLGNPGYNDKIGFKSGPQTDIFALDSEDTGATPPVSSTTTSSGRADPTFSRVGGVPGTISSGSSSAPLSSSSTLSSALSYSSILPTAVPVTSISSVAPTSTIPLSEPPSSAETQTSSLFTLSMTTIRVGAGVPTTVTSTAASRSTTMPAVEINGVVGGCSAPSLLVIGIVGVLGILVTC